MNIVNNEPKNDLLEFCLKKACHYYDSQDFVLWGRWYKRAVLYGQMQNEYQEAVEEWI